MSQIVNDYQTKLDNIAQNIDILTDAERLERSMGNLISIHNFLIDINSYGYIYQFYFDSINILFFSAECGECLIYYPNVTKDFEKINLEVTRENSIYIYLYDFEI